MYALSTCLLAGRQYFVLLQEGLLLRPNGCVRGPYRHDATNLQMQLASVVKQGMGCKADGGQAPTWLTQVAEAGSAAAQAELGSLLRTGTHCTADPVAAVRGLRMAATAGDASAKKQLLAISEQGAGQPSQASCGGRLRR